MDFIKLEIKLNPKIGCQTILNKLMEKYPNDFYKGHLRTLQRRVHECKLREENREESYKKLMIEKKNMTNELLLKSDEVE